MVDLRCLGAVSIQAEFEISAEALVAAVHGACEHNGWHIGSLLNTKSGSAPYLIAIGYSRGIRVVLGSFPISERYWLAPG